MSIFNMDLPSFDDVDDQKQRKQIKNYLYTLNEQLRYALSHIDTTNFTDDVKQAIESSMTLSETFNKEIETLTDNGIRLNSKIKQTAEEISFKVSKNDIISAINQTAEEIQILANRIKLEGYTSINGGFVVDEYGRVEIMGDVKVRDTLYMFASSEEVNGVPGNFFNCMTITADPFSGITEYILNIGLGGGEGLEFSDIRLNGYTALTINNKDYYTYPPNTHTHSQYSSTGHIHDTLYNGNYTAFFSSSGNFANRNNGDLGSPTYKWNTLYASSGTINTSDKNAKHDIYPLDEVYKQMILRLRPVKFKYNDGTSNRYHTGFLSQDVEALINELGLTSLDFAAFVKSPVYSVVNENGEYDISSEITGYIYGLRYEEFTAPTIAVVQEQQKEIDKLKEELNLLKEILTKNGIQ